MTAGASNDAGLTSHKVTVLLVDDQPIIGEAVRRMLAGEDDIVFHYCKDAARAVEEAARVAPTVILQDLVMPDIDGLTLVKTFRENPATREIPMIVLSSKEDPKVKAEAFALGANDYVVKLPDRLELLARIRYHSKGYIALLQRNEAYDALVASQKILANDLAQAAKYVRSLLPDPLRKGPVRSEWRFVPSTSLGGDTFGYHWLDDDHLVMFLLDVSGHGVGPALLSVSAYNAIRSQSLPQTGFSSRTRPGARRPEPGLPDGPAERPLLHDLVRHLQQDEPHHPLQRRWTPPRHPPDRPQRVGGEAPVARSQRPDGGSADPRPGLRVVNRAGSDAFGKRFSCSATARTRSNAPTARCGPGVSSSSS